MNFRPFRIVQRFDNPSQRYLREISNNQYYFAEHNQHFRPTVLWVSTEGCEQPDAECILADMWILRQKMIYFNVFDTGTHNLPIVCDGVLYHSLFSSNWAIWDTKYRDIYHNADWLHVALRDD